MVGQRSGPSKRSRERAEARSQKQLEKIKSIHAAREQKYGLKSISKSIKPKNICFLILMVGGGALPSKD